MKISNLGVLKSVDLNLSNLMVFTGENNSGKTYTSYLLYGLLSHLKENRKLKLFNKDEIVDLLNIGEKTISLPELRIRLFKKLQDYLNKNIKDIAVRNFKISEEEFNELSVKISENDLDFIFSKDRFVKEELERVVSIDDFIIKISYQSDFDNFIFSSSSEDKSAISAGYVDFINGYLSYELLLIPKTFYYPAERNGINVFKNELNEGRLKTYDTLINTIQYTNLKNKKEQDKMREQLFKQHLELLYDGGSNLYPKPISDYINFLNTIKPRYNQSENSSASYIRDEIIKGRYEIDEQTNQVYFKEKYGKRYRTKAIPFHVLSSSIKSLYGLDYYLDTVAKTGDVLIIDEPELSLHPENQIKLARALSDIVRSGIRVILSTHSDLLIRELTNIILKNKVSDGKEGIGESEVNLYNFKKGRVEEYEDLSTIERFDNFDESIFQLQDKFNELLDLLDEKNNQFSEGDNAYNIIE